MKLRALIIVLLIANSKLFSIDKTAYFSTGVKLDAKEFVLPDSEDSLKVFVFFRVSNQAINFKKSIDDNNETFSTNLDLELIAQDESGIIRKRLPYSDTYKVNSYVETISREKFYSGYLEFKLLNKKHNLELEFSSGKGSKTEKIQLEILKFEEDNFKTLSPVFILNDNNESYRDLKVFRNKSGFSFGPYSSRLFIPIKNLKSEILTYDMKLIKNDKEEQKNYFDWSDDVEILGNVNLIKFRNIKFERVKNNILLSIDRGESIEDQQFMEIILPEDKIIPGTYKLNIEADNSTIYQYTFDIKWGNKPLSLNNPEFAAKKMYYILTDDEYEELRDGSENEIFKKIIKYWDSRDPTPATPFNEAMNQYFTRVDFALFNFRTLAEKDGADTDRGKIFILKGLPDTISAKVESGESYKIWTYKGLKEEYWFKLMASTVYVLVEIKEI